MKIFVVQLCLLVAFVVHSSKALECYQCEGKPDGDCAKGVASAMNTIDCPNGPGLQVAMCLQTDLRSGSERTFERGCTKWSNPTYCTLMYRLAAQNPAGLRVFSCNQCSEAKCNTHLTV